jgi:hypothetical protein
MLVLQALDGMWLQVLLLRAMPLQLQVLQHGPHSHQHL